MKLAIIVPYRDRREELDVFLPHMINFLNNKQIDYNIYIIEQFDEKPFNYGKLCNIGVNETIEFADYYCFHDVDILPLNDDADYSYKESPTELIFEDINGKSILPYSQYFGGAVILSKEEFLKINGFNNNYWGKGYVDLDLLYRCEKNGLPLVKKYNYNNTSNLKMDLKSRSIVKKASQVTIFKNSLIASIEANAIARDFTLTFHYQDIRVKNNKSKICLFRTYGKDILQLFSVDKQFIFQFFDNGKFFQFEINEVDIEKLNHYSITHDYVNKTFTIYINGNKIKQVEYDLTYDYVNKTVAIGDKENKQKFELYDFKLFDRKLTDNEVTKNYYYGLKGSLLDFSTISFFKDNSKLIDKKFNIWEILSKEEDLTKNRGAFINSNYELKLNNEVKIPNKLKGKYRLLNEKFVDIQDTYDPDILENRRSFYEHIVSGKVDTNKYGFNTLKYTFLNKEKIDRNVIWIKALV